jgi:hypothetical protein
MNVAHGSSLNNDLVLHPYIVSESRELFFHLILQVAITLLALKGCWFLTNSPFLLAAGYGTDYAYWPRKGEPLQDSICIRIVASGAKGPHPKC